MNYQISYTCLSHVGRVRRTNQDNFICAGQHLPWGSRGTADPLRGQASAGERPLFGVFDGMGGEEQGEAAAYLAAASAQQTRIGPRPLKTLDSFCSQVNREILDYAREHGVFSMGTTAALLTFSGDGVCLCNIGDSRIFRFREGKVTQLSQDHVMPCAFGGKPPLSQNLGIPETEIILEPHLIKEKVKDGDVYLACSDGLTDMLSAEEIQRILREAGPDQAAEALLKDALDRGGRDNITLILCQVIKRQKYSRKMKKTNYERCSIMEEKDVHEKKNGGAAGKKKGKILAAVLTAVVILALGGFFLIRYLNTPASIEILTLPDQLTYDYAAELDPAGLSLNVTYNSGREAVVTEDITCEPMELLTAGTQEITVSYRGQTAQFSVEAIPVLTGIRVTQGPETVRYLSGSQLQTEGLTLEADYNDGSVTELTEGFACAPMDLEELGTQDITVTYEDKETTFPVEVVKVTELTARIMPVQTVYMVGDTPDPTGLSLSAVFSNGDKEPIQEGYSYLNTRFTEPGTQEVQVYYGGAEASYSVEVLPDVDFGNMESYYTCVSYGDDSGKNAYGGDVNWAIIFEFDLPAEIRNNMPLTVSSSWGHVTNGEGTWEKSCDYESAKKGVTFLETGIYQAQNSPTGNERFSITLYLPDDPGIEGPQSVDLHVGNATMTVNFVLTYAGGYETGTGWTAYDFTYSLTKPDLEPVEAEVCIYDGNQSDRGVAGVEN